MLVSDVKRTFIKGNDLLECEDSDAIIEKIIEKPLQKACKEFKNKNIETCMSSANKKNVIKKGKKPTTINDVINKMKKHKLQTFLQAGKGYAWVMLNYNSLSKENKKILFSLRENLGEDTIWFVKPTFANFYKKFQKKFKMNDVILSSGDEYDKIFEQNNIVLMYNTNLYPGRSVFIRMPINDKTSIEDVETYYDNITEKLAKQ